MNKALLQAFVNIDGWQISEILIKAVTYGATFTSTGGAVFLLLFAGYQSAKQQQLLQRFICAVALIGIALSVGRIAIMNGMLSGDWRDMLDATMTRMVLESKEGIATGVRVFALLLLVVFVRTIDARFTRAITILSALFASASFALAGHAGDIAVSAIPHQLPPLLLGLHLIAAMFWIGALWPLRCYTYEEDLQAMAVVMHKFGRMAAFVVALLIAVGMFLLLLIIDNVSLLWTSAYGQAMMTKLLVVSLLLALAALNKWRLAPLMLLGDRVAVKKLRDSISAEIVLVALVLLITAFFTTVVGPA